MRTLLCVDDDANALLTRRLVLESQGYKVLVSTSGRTAVDLAHEHEIDAVVLDYQMPDNGWRSGGR
jgi:CheY-like chemotaxis protein